jgi:hypothetical protein
MVMALVCVLTAGGDTSAVQDFVVVVTVLVTRVAALDCETRWLAPPGAVCRAVACHPSADAHRSTPREGQPTSSAPRQQQRV